MVNIFTASTPLNALLCSTVALNLNEKCYLFLIDQEEHLAGRHLEIFRSLEGECFDKVLHVSTRSKSIFSIAKKRRVIKNIKKIVSGINYFNLWMCNDRRYENQFLIKKSKLHDGLVTYVDDGLYSYNEKVWKNNSFLFFLRRFILGSWIKKVETLGAGLHVDQVALFFPSNANKGIKSKKNVEFKKKSFEFLLNRIWAVERIYVQNNSVLVLMPHLSGLISEDRLKLESIISRHLSEGHDVYVKIHPRDNEFKLGIDGVKRLDDAVPVEYFLSNYHFNYLYSGLSSVLLTAHWMGVENICCYSAKDVSFLNFLNVSQV